MNVYGSLLQMLQTVWSHCKEAGLDNFMLHYVRMNIIVPCCFYLLHKE